MVLKRLAVRDALAIGAVWLVLVPAAWAQKGTPAPEWIWTAKDAGDDDVAYFRRTFEIGRPTSAQLVATCDNAVVVYINGKEVLKNDSWELPAVDDVTRSLRPGRNVIAAQCRNGGGQAGFLLRAGRTPSAGPTSGGSTSQNPGMSAARASRSSSSRSAVTRWRPRARPRKPRSRM